MVFTGRNAETVREKFPDAEILGYAIDSLLNERTVDEEAAALVV